MVFLTDFFGAAKQKVKVEAEQGKMMVDVAKANGIEYLVFLSVADLEPMQAFRLGKKVHHFTVGDLLSRPPGPSAAY